MREPKCLKFACLLFPFVLVSCGGPHRTYKSLDGDVTASFRDSTHLVYLVPTLEGTLVKEFNFQKKSSTLLLETSAKVVGVSAAPGTIYFEARTSTPNGKQTIQIFTKDRASSDLVPCLPPDESIRCSMTTLSGSLTYLKATSWEGAFGGMPWGPPVSLCHVDSHGQESIVAQVNGVAHGVYPQGGAYCYPLNLFTGRTENLFLINVKDGLTKAVGNYQQGGGAAVSPNGSLVAICVDNMGRAAKVIEVDSSSGAVKSTGSIAEREIQVLYAPDGKLFVVTGEANTGRASLSEVAGGRIMKVASLQ